MRKKFNHGVLPFKERLGVSRRGKGKRDKGKGERYEGFEKC